MGEDTDSEDCEMFKPRDSFALDYIPGYDPENPDPILIETRN